MTPDSLAHDAFFRLHAGLPQQGPGSDASTREALRRLEPFHPAPRILDLGCGPGRQTLALARETGGFVTAVDTHGPFLTELERRAEAEGLASRVRAVEGSMEELGPETGLYDLIWSEGAIYHVGFDRGLELWRPLLDLGGSLAVTELSWLGPEPSDEVRAFWAEGYPAMRDAEANAAAFAGRGYELVDRFTLPESDWVEGYYGPLEERLAKLEREELAPAAREVVEMERREIELFRRSGGSYGYVFYLARGAE